MVIIVVITVRLWLVRQSSGFPLLSLVLDENKCNSCTFNHIRSSLVPFRDSKRRTPDSMMILIHLCQAARHPFE